MTAVANVQENIFFSSTPGSLLHRNHLCSQKWLIFSGFYYELCRVYLFIYYFSKPHTYEREHEELRMARHPTFLHPPATQNPGPGSDRHLPRASHRKVSSPSTNARAGRAALPPRPHRLPLFPLLQLPSNPHPAQHPQPFTRLCEAHPRSQLSSEIALLFFHLKNWKNKIK